MSTSSKSGPCCLEPEKTCNCGRRCKVTTSMTLKNPMRRFARAEIMVNESLDERVRSMVVGFMVSNDTMAAKIKRLKNDLEAQKHEVKKLKEKNRRMKLKFICLCSVVAAVLPLFATFCPVYAVATINRVKTVVLSCAGSIRRKMKDSGAAIQNGGKE
ncbi:hypothetical protein Cgig2_006256 [Carnegiea gigantea]|uniref:Transmembrane protein n=1 Tax=Carnegiea gigantea TaxID=171969 RepID=A0A9Q1JPT2_9CARY|nr:hypothetical protein Cgig2_006256 [Carnegiea gigantea]